MQDLVGEAALVTGARFARVSAAFGRTGAP
jgi:hypothetical protein